MGALTGNTIQSTYLDLVQLGKSGAGLPSHAGKEAALYDGAGYQILGRTAVRHWLDPHPDAASFDETWEFSTKGTMTQVALEAAGWTFENCTAVVANGLLTLTATGGIVKASLAVSFAGDFDVCVTPVAYNGVVTGNPYNNNMTANWFSAGVADYRAGTADLAHYVTFSQTNNGGSSIRYVTGAYTTYGGTDETDTCNSAAPVLRVFRTSGATALQVGTYSGGMAMFVLETDPNTGYSRYQGFTNNAAVADASTYNKLFILGTLAGDDAGAKHCFASIRRFQ